MHYYRPCLDIHQGKIKQIVGSTLTDKQIKANFVSDQPAIDYAEIYHQKKLTNGHIVMLSQTKQDKKVVREILKKFPNTYAVGGGMNDQNCQEWIENGAKKIIFSSFLFNPLETLGQKLEMLNKVLKKSQIVIDLSCLAQERKYFIAINRWETVTSFEINKKNLTWLSSFAGEFLIHAISNEGKKSGIDLTLVKKLAEVSPIPCTYGGGVTNYRDIELIKKYGDKKIFFTVGSGLDLFGGDLKLLEVIKHSSFIE